MDEIDAAQAREQLDTNSAIAQVRGQAAQMQAGDPGDCELCGERSGRLIKGACAPCRDRYRLP